MDSAEQDVLAYMTFPGQHWAKLHSTNLIERPNGEIKRRTEVVGIFPNGDAIVRLVGALLLEQNDEWAVQWSRAFRFGTFHMNLRYPGATTLGAKLLRRAPVG